MGRIASAVPAAAAVEQKHEGEEKKKNNKGKKKGRPSLLDIQKRNIRLERDRELEQQHRQLGRRKSRSPNPSDLYRRRPSPASRTSHRSPDWDSAAVEGTIGGGGDDDNQVVEEVDEDTGHAAAGGRRQRKLRLVLGLPPDGWRDELGASSSESEGDGCGAIKKRRVEDVNGSSVSETEKLRSASKLAHTSGHDVASRLLQGGTPIPDKKLLVFVLDRLQKKDTYGVYSEPVDPEELPDYRDVIEYPMDFSTIRKKLTRGAYANLEEFEEDVFLISSNAMRYNAPETIYFRQARAIQELAKKDFENLRQESDDDKSESKPVTMGRMLGKDVSNKTTSRPLAELGVSIDPIEPQFPRNDLHSTKPTDAFSNIIDSQKCGFPELEGRAFQKPQNVISPSKLVEHKPHRNDESSGLLMKEPSRRYWKKITMYEENRRNTYKQTSATICQFQPSFQATFEEEKKELVTVGVHMDNTYARSLAHFAAKFGPIGWEIAVQLIKKSLPPGTKFGRGWVGDKDAPQQNQPPIPSKAKKFTGNLEGSVSLITFDKNNTDHLLHSSAATETVTTEHPDKVEHYIFSNLNPEMVLNTNTDVQSKYFSSHPNRRIQPSDNASDRCLGYSHHKSETFTRSLGAADMAKIQENSLVSNKGNNPMHPVDAGRFRKTPCNSVFFSSCTTKASQLYEENGRLEDPSPPTNSASNFFHLKDTIHMKSEKTKTNHSGTLNSMSNLIRQSSFHHLKTGNTNSGNPCKIESTNSFIHCTEIGALEAGKREINGRLEVNENSFFCSSRTGCLDEDGVIIGNAQKRDLSHQPTAELLFQSELAKRDMLGFMSSRRQPSLAVTTAPCVEERTAESDVRTVNSGGEMVESVKVSVRTSQGLSLSQNAFSVPPDLNIRSHSPSSPMTAVMVDSQQPDLALQL